MNIGIVTTWFDRGAAFVSKQYLEAFNEMGNNVFIFARYGEIGRQVGSEWDQEFVTWGKRLPNQGIKYSQFIKWINKNNIELVIFNEQANFLIVTEIKKKNPSLKIGAYVDYYSEEMLPWFNIYDFLLCNTKRHMQAMDFHPQSFYIKWGTDIELFKPEINDSTRELTFFHSAGMSNRKGTDILIDTFIENNFGEKSKLIIHTQKNLEKMFNRSFSNLQEYNIEVIEKTVSAPGLYHLGDIYVYPTRLDGLGLTMYEALACGMPVITTDYPPMNEIINNEVGWLLKVERNYCRKDGYYWPMSKVDKKDLADAIRYYIINSESLGEMREKARNLAENNYSWKNNSKCLSEILEAIKPIKVDNSLIQKIEDYYRNKKIEPYKEIIRNSKILAFFLPIIKK